MKRLEVIIGTNGEINCESINFEGKACQDAMQFLNKVGEKIDDKKKPEFYK